MQEQHSNSFKNWSAIIRINNNDDDDDDDDDDGL